MNEDMFRNVKKLKKLGFNITPELVKKPILKEWNKRELTIYELESYYTKRDYNVGIVVGLKGEIKFCVIDVDVEGLDNWMRLVKEKKIDTSTYSVATPSGGFHYYYECDRDMKNCHILEGVEIKGLGGKVTAPPSISIVNGIKNPLVEDFKVV